MLYCKNQNYLNSFIHLASYISRKGFKIAHMVFLCQTSVILTKENIFIDSDLDSFDSSN